MRTDPQRARLAPLTSSGVRRMNANRPSKASAAAMWRLTP